MSLSRNVQWLGFVVSACTLVGALIGAIGSISDFRQAQAGIEEVIKSISVNNGDVRVVYAQLVDLDEIDLRLVALGNLPACTAVTCGTVVEASAKTMAADALGYKQSLDSKANNAITMLISLGAMLIALYAVFHPHVVSWWASRTRKS